ncbi:MAG: hypothetical protein KatS3mg012_1825 [Gaiellaceae bacterium]|nr:MAG: hypothetical protein KatS3mg012_1825 [Gaiellaceae bacterium]
MSGTTSPERKPPRLRLPLSSERLMWIEVVVLAPLAAILVLLAFPSWFEIDWGCVSTTTGVMRTAGDAYIATFGVLGTLGWLLVVMAALFANVTGSSRFAAYLPVAWFTALVTSALIAAAAIGPQICS